MNSSTSRKVGPASSVKSPLYPLPGWGNDRGFDKYQIPNTCKSNAPVWGLVFCVNPPVLSPIVPGRGVVGHYIDRCINDVLIQRSGWNLVEMHAALHSVVTELQHSLNYLWLQVYLL